VTRKVFILQSYWSIPDQEGQNIGRYEAYSESKYRFAVKKSSKVSYKILLLSDSTFFELSWGIYRSGAQVFLYSPHRMRPPITQMTTDNVMEYSLWNLRKVQGQIRNCETSVVTHSFVDLTHQIIIHQRWTPTSRLIVHILSSFIKIGTHFLTMLSLIALSPYTWQIWWWISLGSTFLAFKKTNYRPYFTVGGPFICLKHV